MAILDATRVDYTLEEAEHIQEALRGLAEVAKAEDSMLRSIGFAGETKAFAVIIGTLSHARRIYSHLVHAYTTLDIPLCGWAGRSLVELRVWNRYVWASVDNRKRFHDGNITDQNELEKMRLDYIYELTNARLNILRTNGRGPEGELAIEHVEAELDKIDKLRISIRGMCEGRLQVKQICKEVNLEQFYRFWFGTLSKLAHPTPAVLVDIETGKEVLLTDDIRPIFVMGTQSAIEILNTAVDGLGFREGVEKWIEIQKSRQARSTTAASAPPAAV